MKDWEKSEVVPFELKTVGETDQFYEFKGYASVFNVPDRINDRVQPGAFKRTIDHHKGEFPLAWMHNPEEIIGSVKVQEDEKGLFVDPGYLVKGIQRAEDVYRLMKAKVVNGMSFSYRAIQKTYSGKYRDLKELAVGEITLGPRSMICHPDALVTTVKTAQVEDILNNHLERLANIIGVKVWHDSDKSDHLNYRIRKADEFKQLRSWTIHDKTIRLVGGPLKKTGEVVIQEVQFSKKDNWTLEKAQAWKDDISNLKFYEINAAMKYFMSANEVKIEHAS